MLREGVYPLKYLEEWEKFNEASLPENNDLHSNLNLEDITDSNYIHAKRICKDYDIKYLGEYHDFYLKSDTLLLADVFEICRKMYLEIYQLDPAHFPNYQY